MSTMSAEPAGPARASNSPRAQEILAISARLFDQNGYAATTVQDIADAAEMLPGSLYHHFESKDAIAVELLELFDSDIRIAAETSLHVDASRLSGVQAETHLRDLTRDLVTVNRQHAAAVRLRAYEAPPASGPALQRAVRGVTPELSRAWSKALTEVLRNPAHRPGNPALLNFAFQRVTLTSTTVYPRTTNADLIADQLCDLLLNGLLTAPPAIASLDSSSASDLATRAIAGWRRNSTEADDPKSRILAAARTEFGRHGYEASTIRGIADTAGITMGTLYRRAESKEAILREILQRYSTYLDGAVTAILTNVESVPESLDALARLFISASRRFAPEAAIVSLGSNGKAQPDSPFTDYLLQTRKRLGLLENVIDRGLRDGSIRAIGTAAEIAPHYRQLMWLPYQTQSRTSERRAHAFIREDILGGMTTPPTGE